MKKKLSITFTVLGGAVAIVGMGLLGGTYNSFKNYQSIITIQNYDRNYDYDNMVNQDYSSLSNWNTAIAKMSQSDKDAKNKEIQNEKNQFYKTYPTYDDFKKNMSSYITNKQLIKDSWGVEMALFSLDYNYDAEQAGVAAGSVLLVVGVVAFIGFLVVLLKKKKV